MSAWLQSFLKRRPLLSAGGVFLSVIAAACWVFGDVVSFQPLLYDDPEYLTGRPAGFGLAYWRELTTASVVNLWHPLTVFSHDLVERLGGNALWRHHLVNILLHLGVACSLVYWLRGLSWSLSSALAVVLVWMFHPCLVESVAWVSGRKDILSALFILWSLGAAARGKSVYLVFFLAVGALLAKPVAVVLPGVLLIQDLALRGKSLWDVREWWGLLRRYAAVVLVSLVVILVTLIFQGQGGQAIEDPRTGMERLTGAGWALWGALRLWFYPFDLHTAYDDPAVLPVIFGLFAFVLMGGAAWGMTSSRLSVTWRLGLALFLLFLLPTLGFIRAGNHLVADRYLYLPGLGLSLLVVRGLGVFRTWGLAVAIILAVTLGSFTKEQRKHWVDTRSLFERVLEIRPQHSYALGKIGTLERIDGRLDSAKDYYHASLAQDSGSPDAHKNLAEMALEEKNYKLAHHHYAQLLQRWRREVWLYERLAKLAFNLGNSKQALSYLERGLQVARTSEEASRLGQLQAEMQAP